MTAMTAAISRSRLVPLVLVLAVTARAQSVDPLPAETQLVAISGAPAATEKTFNIASAQDLIVTLTDLQVPAALISATVVVTQGGTIVGAAPPTSGSASIVPPATTATVTIPGAVGQYTLRVVGAPNAAAGIGTFSVCVAPKASPTNCIITPASAPPSFTGNITAQPASAPATSTVTETLNVVTAGNYTVTYADDAFPVALSAPPQVALFEGSTMVGGTPPLASGTVVPLTPGTYSLLAVAQANATTPAGLYGIVISGPGGALLDKTYAVGSLAAATPVTNPISQALTLKVTDFAFPAALGSGSAVATEGGTILTPPGMPATLGTAANLGTVPAGALQVWTYATAGSGAGTYEVDLGSASTSLLQTAAAVNQGSAQAYAFLTSSQSTGTLAAGSYQATATDFNFPSALSTLQFAVAQNAAILQQTMQQGTLKFTAAAGPVVLLVGATPPMSGNGLFDVNVQNSSGSVLFDQTEAVGASAGFDTQTLTVDTAGQFSVTLTDLMFPAAFQNLAMVVSSGGTVLGQIFGGGTFNFSANSGNYQLTFVATPAAQQNYGLYGVQVVPAPPNVTLTAAPTTVTAGGSSTLSWTTTNATACTASGGLFTGSEATGSGSASVMVSATTTYQLSCTGPGGSNSASATVTATAAPPSSGGGGGGGAIDLRLIGVLGVLGFLRARRGMRFQRRSMRFQRRSMRFQRT